MEIVGLVLTAVYAYQAASQLCSKYRQKLAARRQGRNEKLEQDLRLSLRQSPRRIDEKYNTIYDGLDARLGPRFSRDDGKGLTILYVIVADKLH